MYSLEIWILGALLALSLGLYYARSKTFTTGPVGPPGLPIIGNLHQIPKSGAHHRFTQWSKVYGGIFGLKLGPARAVVITDRRAIKELIDKKGSIYSSRPPSYVSHDLITRGDHLLVMDYGDRWRLLRRTLHQFFMETMCDTKHMALVEAEETQMMRDFLVSPENLMVHTKRTSNSIIMSLVFGTRTESHNTMHMKKLYAVMERWSEVMETGATPPVDIYSFLKILPESLFGNWIQRSLVVGKMMKELYSGWSSKLLARRLEKGSSVSFMDQVLDQQDKLPLNPNQRDFLGGFLVEGGSDTVSSMMLVVIQALALNPDVQRKAQDQIDAVCDDESPPTWSNYEQLPYISMIVKEAMRWRPVTPLAFPHSLAKDDIVDGKLLTRGTTVFINVWGLQHDEQHFPDPDRFDPERYEGRTRPAAEYAASADYDNRDHYTYGAGRRICPGIHLAERQMFLGTAKLLWGFNFEQQRDGDGRVIPIDTDPMTGYTEGFLVCPKDFACRVLPRSERRAATIMREFEKADKEVFSQYR